MEKKLLIDAGHPETRLAVVEDGRIEAFGFDAKENGQLRGNIYLGSVSHVEPSLQAAFVNYGGHRDGFLPMDEIHPTYYEIPDGKSLEPAEVDQAQVDFEAAIPEPELIENPVQPSAPVDDELAGYDEWANEIPGDPEWAVEDPVYDDDGPAAAGERNGNPEASARTSSGGGRRAAAKKPKPIAEKPYQIQEVIKTKKPILVQVSREPRGSKGVALTTNISLAGRFCVLMPMSRNNQGGVSRKIRDSKQQARLRTILKDLENEYQSAIIIRSAGVECTEFEIRDDLKVLRKIWEGIREDVTQGNAPLLIYKDSDLIKDSLRDLHSKNITEILIKGDDAYRDAKQYMQMFAPDQTEMIKRYNADQPLFTKYDVNRQVEAFFDSKVVLPSGGWIFVETTEAITSIDVNSGGSTRNRNIEDTAVHTNLEAAAEAARQLRLRDISGLIVIDFIDMDRTSNRMAVEQRFRDYLKFDDAMTETSRISKFGILEMSRQRIRKNILDMSTQVCPHCHHGKLRTTESLGTAVLRRIEERAFEKPRSSAVLRVPERIFDFLGNDEQQDTLNAFKKWYDLEIQIKVESSLSHGSYELIWNGVLDKVDPMPPRKPSNKPLPKVSAAPERKRRQGDRNGAARTRARAKRSPHPEEESASGPDSLNQRRQAPKKSSRKRAGLAKRPPQIDPNPPAETGF